MPRPADNHPMRRQASIAHARMRRRNAAIRHGAVKQDASDFDCVCSARPLSPPRRFETGTPRTAGQIAADSEHRSQSKRLHRVRMVAWGDGGASETDREVFHTYS